MSIADVFVAAADRDAASIFKKKHVVLHLIDFRDTHDNSFGTGHKLSVKTQHFFQCGLRHTHAEGRAVPDMDFDGVVVVFRVDDVTKRDPDFVREQKILILFNVLEPELIQHGVDRRFVRRLEKIVRRRDLVAFACKVIAGCNKDNQDVRIQRAVSFRSRCR